MQFEVEDLTDEFAAKPPFIHIELANREEELVSLTVRGFDDYESWLVLQELSLTMYAGLTDEEREWADEWFDDAED